MTTTTTNQKRSTTKTPPQQQQTDAAPSPKPCPRCDTNPAPDPEGEKICAECVQAEADEAKAGEEDARASVEARKANDAAAAAKAAEEKAGQQTAAAPAQQQAKAPAPAQQQQAPAQQQQTQTQRPPAQQQQQQTQQRPAQQSAPAAAAQAAQRAAQRQQQTGQQMPAGQRPAQGGRQVRMTLDSVKANAAEEAPVLWVYGVEGIGKSTFAADTPSPIFLPGGKKSPNIRRKYFPIPVDFQDVIDAVGSLATGEHQYETLVFDDFDYIEGLAWDLAIKRYNGTGPKQLAHSIEDVGGGYGRGYQAAVDVFRTLIVALERMRAAKPGMMIIFVSHAVIKNYKNPNGNDYDRFVNSMHEKAVALFRKWCDAMLFVNYIDRLKHDWKAKKTLAEGDGHRAIFTQRRPTHDAKNRYDLPYEMPLDYTAPFQAVADGIKQSREPEILLARIEEKIEQINDPAITTWVRGQLAMNWPVDVLSRINKRLADKLDELQAPPEDAPPADDGAAQ